MNPIMARWEIRRMDDFTVEKLARLHQKRDGWICQRAHNPSAHGAGRGRCSPTRPIRGEERRRRLSHGGRGKETT
jgi:hypothetical protein